MEKQNKEVENSLDITLAEVASKWNKVFSGYIPEQYGFYNFMGGMQNNPFLANQRVKNLSTQPAQEARRVLEEALLDPENNEMTIRGATHSVLNQTYPLYRLQYLYEGILSYNHYAHPVYVDKSDISSPRFKNESEFIDQWIKKLDPKRTFRRITAEIMAEGKKSYVIRQDYDRNVKSSSGKKESEIKYVMLQNLPSDFYKLTGISSDSYYLTSFDFMYFFQPGVSLDQFPPMFKELFDELAGIVREDKRGKKYINPADVTRADITLEYKKGVWAYWAQLPSDLAWMFCFTEADANAVSPFSSLLLMGSDLSNYNLLQQQLVSAPLNSIILGEIPMVADPKATGFAPDTFSLSPQAVSMFENSINSAFRNKNIAFKMTPTKQNQMFNVPDIPNAQNIYNEAVRGMVNTAGSGALQAMNDKPSVSQTNNARIIEQRFIDRLYKQFEHFVNTMFDNMYKEGDLIYRWRFKMFGNALLEAQEVESLEKSLTLGQTHLFPMYLAYKDLSMGDAMSISDWVEETKIYDKFKPLVNSFTMKDGSSTSGSGRPKVANPSNDNTAASQESGADTGEARDSE